MSGLTIETYNVFKENWDHFAKKFRKTVLICTIKTLKYPSIGCHFVVKGTSNLYRKTTILLIGLYRI